MVINEKRPKSHQAIKLWAGIFVVAVCGILLSVVILETAARALWKHEYNKLLSTTLHGYDQIDSERSILVPIPNTVITKDRHIANLNINKKPLGLKEFERSISDTDNVSGSDVLFTINKHGFKGPDFDIPKPKDVFRILTIGDSCTFLPTADKDTYARIMERELRKNQPQGKQIEVVNAGFPGYNIEAVLKRLDEFLAVDPDLVTIYIGWNRTIARANPARNNSLYRQFALYRFYYHLLVNPTGRTFMMPEANQMSYDANDPTMDRYRDYNFSHDVQDLETLVSRIRIYNESTKIMLITLAGLFDSKVEPDQEAFDVAFPIASSQNLYAWPALTSSYNNGLRALTRRTPGVDLIDLESKALEIFVPRTQNFTDPVHLSPEGSRKMGVFFAEEVQKYLN